MEKPHKDAYNYLIVQKFLLTSRPGDSDALKMTSDANPATLRRSKYKKHRFLVSAFVNKQAREFVSTPNFHSYF